MRPTIVDWILDFFWPSRCIFCGKIIPPQKLYCPGCIKQLSPVTSLPPLFYLDIVLSFTRYSYTSSSAIYRLKFRNQPKLAATLAQMMAERFCSQLSKLSIDLICDVPMSPQKQRQRGYNQAQLLAQQVAKQTNIPYAPLLEKIKTTPEQHTLGAEQRKHNLKDAYRVVSPQQVLGKRILIIDDVITTGSTMNECAHTLRDAGAEWVGALSFAHTTMIPNS